MKLKMRLILLFMFCACLDCGSSQPSKVYQLIYKDFDVNHYDKCVRLLNGVKEVGCQSSEHGNVGVLYHINSAQSLAKFVIRQSTLHYVVLLEAQMFYKNLLIQWKNDEKIHGLVLYQSDNFTFPQWSPELTCPNQMSSLYSATYGNKYAGCKNWNTVGDGIAELNIPFPVFYVRTEAVRDSLIQCHNEHNMDDTYPLCAVQMKSRMFGAVDSVTCVRRTYVQSTLTPVGFCDPMGGQNVVTALKSLSNASSKAEKTILLTAALDSQSFMSSFTAPGVNKATGFITMLGVAQALGKLSKTQKEELDKNILFIAFDGEAFDNIGSTRLVADMMSGNFPVIRDSTKVQPNPVSLDNITHVIELGQLGLTDHLVWAHYDPVSYSSTVRTQVDLMITTLQNHASSLNVTQQTTSAGIGLPPSSIQSILKHQAVPSLLLTDYNLQFTNKHFFSRYDTLRRLGVNYTSNSTDEEIIHLLQPLSQKLANISTMVARTLITLAGSTLDPASLSTNTSTMAQMLFCFLCKPDCDLFNEHDYALSTSQLSQAPVNRYVSVYDAKKVNFNVNMTLKLLASFTGEISNTPTCVNDPNDMTVNHYWLKGPVNGTHQCVTSSSFLTPAIDIHFAEGADISQYAASPSLWTESRWSQTAFQFRMFLIQEQVKQGMVLLAGLLVLFASIFITFLLHTKANLIFRSTS